MPRSSVHISAVIVTKGDVDLHPVLRSLPFDDIVVWDNSRRTPDLRVYGRYRAMAEAKHPIIYTQDDDCIVDVTALTDHYEPGIVVCNMPPERRPDYPDAISLVGWGACFDRTLCECFSRYFERFPCDELFLREADRVFTALNRKKLVDISFRHLPHAWSGRMWNEAQHMTDLERIRQRIKCITAPAISPRDSPPPTFPPSRETR